MIEMIKKLWLTISLKKKLGSFSILVAMVMALSVLFNIQIMNFSLESFHAILDDNSKCYDFQEAIENEIHAFERFVKEQSEENRDSYILACVRTERCISALPYDYSQIGPERYARTWNIKNSYESYSGARDELIKLTPFETNYIPKLYQIYDMQSYLQSYARRLVQATLTDGNKTYQDKVPVIRLTPYLILVFSVIMLAFDLLLSRLLSNTLVAPLAKLAHSSRKIARNDFSGEDLTVENQDELGELVQAFNRMKHSTEGYINTLKANNEMAELLHKEELERIEMEKRLDAAKMEFLKSQINPHFLFNTLNMIACMAKLEDASTTEKMITSMSSLFRYNLKTEEQIVPLEKELKVAQDYIYIQQMRFGSRIQYGCSLEVDAAEVMIPSFTLQPLVENAIVHGLSKKELGGRLFLRIWKREKKVMISVADTGLGMAEEKQKELEQALRGHATARMGIGLGNIYQRIQTLYQGGDVRIYGKEGRGMVVQVTVPQTAHKEQKSK